MQHMTTRKITVAVGKSYPIIVGYGLEKELVAAVRREGAARIAVITDSNVERLHGARVLKVLKTAGVQAEIFSFKAGESNKYQTTVTSLQHQLLKRKYGRDTLIVALGGGVVGDVAGFVAATYLRGVPFIQVPTSLLAMVDSSVGGKVGIDTPYGKNTVGAFWQPKAVVIDLKFIETLPREEFVNGLFEAIKTFMTSDKAMFAKAKKLDVDSPLKNPQLLLDVVHRSVAIKAGIVARDEREQNERRVVNFGHTIGHAIEFLSKFTIPHGFAVGYGMLVEAEIARQLKLLSQKDFDAVAGSLTALGITARPLAKFPLGKILETTRSDKKTKGGMPYYVLLSSIGSVYTHKGQFAHPVSDAVVASAINTLIGIDGL